MSLSRVVIVFFALSPFAFGASKEIMELQRDVALLQDQVRTLQSSLDQKVAAIQTLTQQTLDSVNRTNTAVAVMQSSFNDTMKQQQLSLTAPVANVGQKLDQMSEDFRAVRESVLDMNTRMGKLDAKIADLENLINTVRAPAAPPPPATGTAPPGDPNSGLAPGFAPGGATAGPPPGLQAGALYTSAYSDQLAGKYDIAFQEFSDYLKYFGDTDLAPTAQYSIAEIYFRKADYNNCTHGLRRRAREVPRGPQDPRRALLKKAMCLMKLGRNDSAAARVSRRIRALFNRASRDRGQGQSAVARDGPDGGRPRPAASNKLVPNPKPLIPNPVPTRVCYAVSSRAHVASSHVAFKTLPRICIAMGFPDAQKLLENARREVNAGESFFEFRLDYLPAPEQGIAVIRKFLAAHPDCCILATCRRHQNHGKFNGSVEDQIRILDAALDAGARAVDIEIESAENAIPRLETLRGKGQLVLSYHNYDGTPSPEAVLRRMSAHFRRRLQDRHHGPQAFR